MLRKHEAMSERWLGVETKTTPFQNEEGGEESFKIFTVIISHVSHTDLGWT